MLNERSSFMQCWVGGRRKPSNFPVLLLLPHTAWCQPWGPGDCTLGHEASSSYPHPHKTAWTPSVQRSSPLSAPGGSGQILERAWGEECGVCQLANWWHVTITAVWAPSRDITFVTRDWGRYDARVTVTCRKLREIRDSEMGSLFSWREILANIINRDQGCLMMLSPWSLGPL